MARRINNHRSDEAGFIDLKTGKPTENGDIPVICERVKFYRELRGIGQVRLAQMLGVSKNTIGHWDKGRNRPDIGLIPKLCVILKVTPYVLFGMEEPKQDFSPKEVGLVRKYRSMSAAHRHVMDRLADSLVTIEDAASAPDLRELILFDKPLAAGVGDPSELEEEGRPIYLYSSDVANGADYVFTVNGSSMEPEYHDGDKVLVRKMTDSLDLKYGEVGAFMIGNEMYIKVYEEDGLHSLNPDYRTMLFADEDAVYLIGKVIGKVEREPSADEVAQYTAIHDSRFRNSR